MAANKLGIPLALTVLLLSCGDDSNAGGNGHGGAGGAPTTSTSTTGGAGGEAAGPVGGEGGAGGQGGDGGQGAQGGAGDPCGDAIGTDPGLALVPFVTGIDQPIVMVPDPTKPHRYFVGARNGVIRIVEDGAILPDPFLDLSNIVSCCDDDKGFFSIALHPDYVDNGLFYVDYSLAGTPFDSTTQLVEFHRSDADPNLADPDPVRTLIELPQSDVWHYGGTLAFGPDGYLYYSRGDGGGAGDPENDAQNPLNRYGKILRIDVDTFPDPPPGNMPGADEYVWDMGLRNPWRMSFDRCTGDLYIGDVGQNTYEEISYEPAGQGHNNFGWHMYEGDSCFAGPCDPTGMTMPLVTHNHAQGFCAVIGGYVYRGLAIPALRGRYFYGDICSRRILSFRLDQGAATDPIDHSVELDSFDILGEYGFGSFAEDEDGELYVLDMVGNAIYRIEAE